MFVFFDMQKPETAAVLLVRGEDEPFVKQNVHKMRGVGIEPTKIAPCELESHALTARPSSLGV